MISLSLSLSLSLFLVGPSMDPSGINFVDTIHVYVKSKEAFVWPEHPLPPQPSSKSTRTGPGGGPSTTEGDAEQGSEVMPVVLNKDCSAMDR